MARRKQSTAEDLIELTSKFPWWVGTLLAIGSYVWLSSVASQGMPQSSGSDLSSAMTESLFYAFASLGQYILPGVFGLGAIFSLVMTIKRKKLHGEVSAGERKLSDISWREFEALIGEHFRHKGYQVTETGDGADGGVDLVMRKDGEKYLVQCKHWKAYKVGVKPIRELLGVMASKGATGGIVVASGEFTADGKKFARENNIQLIDGNALIKIVVRPPKDSLRHTVPKNSQQEEEPRVKTEPVCPKCGGGMVVREAKRGPHVGKKFLGCLHYPKCKGIVPIENT